MSIKSQQITGFSVVVLFEEQLGRLEISDFKKALNLSKEEKVTLIELGEMGIGFLSLDEKKKRISLEKKRVVFTDFTPEKENFSEILFFLEKTEVLFKNYKIKAFGLNYDVVVNQDKKISWNNFFSSRIAQAAKGYSVPKFGFKLSLQNKDKKINLNFDSIENQEDSFLVHCNFHHENDQLPNKEDILSLAKENYNHLTNIFISILI